MIATVAAFAALAVLSTRPNAAPPQKVGTNQVVDIELVSDKSYTNPFTGVTVDAIVTKYKAFLEKESAVGRSGVPRVPRDWRAGGHPR